MTCRHCGHNNPPENRFCGMCGHMLLSSTNPPERTSEPIPPPAQHAEPPAPRAESPARRAEPARSSKPAPAPLTGTSFLGLSEPATSDSGGYSYLFQDEPEPSHRGLWVLLLLLVIAGGVVYARWQPIRQYVITNVIPRVRQHFSTTPQPPPPTPAPTADQATISVAPNQQPSEPTPTSQPETSEPQKPADSSQAADEVKQADAKTGEEQPTPDAKTKSEAAADSADEDTPEPASAARRAPARVRKPQPPPPGAELVRTGEKYLYGRGVRKNCNQAVSYFRAAAEQQNPRALSRLGTMYAIGECVPLDRAIAYSWYGRALAVDRGNRLLERNMTMLWREMSPEERQRAGGR